MDNLEKELVDIENKLGGSGGSAPEYVEDALKWHLDYIENLIGGGGSGPSLPDIEEGDAGKAVKVKDDETGYELGSAGGSLYLHTIIYSNNYNRCCYIVTTSAEPITAMTDLLSKIKQYEYVNLVLYTGYHQPCLTEPIFVSESQTKTTFRVSYFNTSTEQLNFYDMDFLFSQSITDTVTEL